MSPFLWFLIALLVTLLGLGLIVIKMFQKYREITMLRSIAERTIGADHITSHKKI